MSGSEESEKAEKAGSEKAGNEKAEKLASDKGEESQTGEVVLSVDRIEKTFRKPFTRRKVEAVRGVSFQVHRGEIFGFLGPNGAGKTTTIKMLTGLISPTGGSAKLMGHAVPSPEAMKRVGFLPENPYVYPYLSPREFVELCGQLSSVPGNVLRKRTEEVLERVGMTYAMDRPVRALSKGMLQRTGLAAALVHNPDMLILDEPMSGLDPVGRKEVRDLIVEEQKAGRTVFFSTHILNDVETLCDRVCILRRGEVVVSGLLHDLLAEGEQGSEIIVAGAGDVLRAELLQKHNAREVGSTLTFTLKSDAEVQTMLGQILASGARVDTVVPKRGTLEELFVRRAL
jgi:ABC-2 type transport system ATP-binding protein